MVSGSSWTPNLKGSGADWPPLWAKWRNHVALQLEIATLKTKQKLQGGCGRKVGKEGIFFPLGSFMIYDCCRFWIPNYDDMGNHLLATYQR